MLSPSNPGWNHKIEPFALPPLTRIVLADVDAGSDTPSLVGKVLKWRQEYTQQGGSAGARPPFPRALWLPFHNVPICSRPIRATADCQWSELRNANAEVASVIERLHDLYEAQPEVYADGVRTAVSTSAKCVRSVLPFLIPDVAGLLTPIQWSSDSSETVKLLGNLHEATEVCHLRPSYGVFQGPEQLCFVLSCPQRVRKGMKRMGESVGVPIEPDEQTRLLDACIQRAGVIGGGVPGGESRPCLPVYLIALTPAV